MKSNSYQAILQTSQLLLRKELGTLLESLKEIESHNRISFFVTHYFIINNLQTFCARMLKCLYAIKEEYINSMGPCVLEKIADSPLAIWNADSLRKPAKNIVHKKKKNTLDDESDIPVKKKKTKKRKNLQISHKKN